MIICPAEAFGKLQESAETLFITDFGKVLNIFPGSANTGDVMQEVNEKILDALDVICSAYQADMSFSVNAIKGKLPTEIMDMK